jgi:hypothetical protein
MINHVRGVIRCNLAWIGCMEAVFSCRAAVFSNKPALFRVAPGLINCNKTLINSNLAWISWRAPAFSVNRPESVSHNRGIPEVCVQGKDSGSAGTAALRQKRPRLVEVIDAPRSDATRLRILGQLLGGEICVCHTHALGHVDARVISLDAYYLRNR